MSGWKSMLEEICYTPGPVSICCTAVIAQLGGHSEQRCVDLSNIQNFANLGKIPLASLNRRDQCSSLLGRTHPVEVALRSVGRV